MKSLYKHFKFPHQLILLELLHINGVEQFGELLIIYKQCTPALAELSDPCHTLELHVWLLEFLEQHLKPLFTFGYR